MSKLICLCNQVKRQELHNLVKKHPCITLGEVHHKTAASTSCGRCREEVKKEYFQAIEKYRTTRNFQLRLPLFDEE